MVESLVITLREGIEAALVVGIILAYLRKTGRTDLSRHIFRGLILAVLASFALAAAFQAIGFDPDNEYLEGALYGVAGIFVASMVVWMWRAARGIKREMEGRLGTITASPSSRATGLGLFIFTFLMVLREGIETVLFLKAAALGEEASPLSFLGGAIGLGLAVVFAILFIRGSLQINLSRFFNVTALALMALAFKLLAGSVHEFGEVKLIPLNRETMAFLGYFVRDDTGALIVTALVAVPIFLLLWEALRRPSQRAAADGESPAERRKRLAAVRLERAWQWGLALAAAVIVLALGASAVGGSKLVDLKTEPVKAAGEEVQIPLEGLHLHNGELHRYLYAASDGTEVRFLMSELEDGSIASGLDACQICGPIGYGQDGKVAVCKNCNAPVPLDSFAFGGGCNPLPLGAEVQGDRVVVPVAELEAAAKTFR